MRCWKKPQSQRKRSLKRMFRKNQLTVRLRNPLQRKLNRSRPQWIPRRSATWKKKRRRCAIIWPYLAQRSEHAETKTFIGRGQDGRREGEIHLARDDRRLRERNRGRQTEGS